LIICFYWTFWRTRKKHKWRLYWLCKNFFIRSKRI